MLPNVFSGPMGKWLTRFALLEILCLSCVAQGGLCDWLYLVVSKVGSAPFEAAATASAAEFPPETPYAWFVGGREPKLSLTPAAIPEIAKVILCCSLKVADMEKILVTSLAGRQTADVSLAEVYQAAFRLGLKKAGVFDPPLCYDCFTTAYTYLDARFYLMVEEREVDHPFESYFSNFQKVTAHLPLRWGDTITIEKDGTSSHVMIYLTNGLVLHKLGWGGDITIEPVTQGVEYYTAYFKRNYPDTPNQVTTTRWRKNDSNSGEKK